MRIRSEANVDIAGRDLEKLFVLREELAISQEVPLIVTDLCSEESLRAMSRRAKVVISTVGPYQLYGAPLLRACVNEKVDYIDLCAEPIWMRQMIDELEAKAIEIGARVLFSCGFASLPSESGVLRLQEIAINTVGAPFPAVRDYVRNFKSGLSGGTAASLSGTVNAIEKDPALAEFVNNPVYLCPGLFGSKAATKERVRFDEVIRAWTMPFFLDSINVANVHRSTSCRVIGTEEITCTRKAF